MLKPVVAHNRRRDQRDRARSTCKNAPDAGRSRFCLGRFFVSIGPVSVTHWGFTLAAFGVLLLSFVFTGTAVAAGEENCSPCHDRVLAAFSGSPHQSAGTSLRGGFRCRECHPQGLVHPKSVSSTASSERCGRCHFLRADDPANSAKPSREPAIRPRTLLDENAWRTDRHSRASVGCTGCHSVHGYAEGADQHLLRQAGDALCLRCHHSVKHKSTTATPDAIAKQPCVSCHHPHGASGSMLSAQSGGDKGDFKKAVVHKPVVEGRCIDCHGAHIVAMGAVQPPEEDEEGTGTEAEQDADSRFKGLLLTPGRVFCYLCHAALQRNFEVSGHARITRFRRGAEQSPCLGCHLPHASDYANLTRYPGNQLCLSCHPGYAPHHFLSRGGVKQSQLQCVKCHNPHGTGSRRLLVQQDVCKLCHKM